MNLKKCLNVVALAACIAGAGQAQVIVNGPVIISEIMYNSAGPEPANEWVELFNSGGATVDISGWYLQDEDGMTGALPGGTMIAPGEALVLCPDLVTVTDFQFAWGATFQVFPLSGFDSSGLNGLANSPSSTNEVLTLRNTSGDIEDEVNYDDAPPWPVDMGSESIYLVGSALDAVSNDNGANWASSVVNVAGAYNNALTAVFPGTDAASPGYVDTGTIPWDHSLTCTQMGNDAVITGSVFGGSAGNFYFLAVAAVNSGVAPSGWFLGINLTFFELNAELSHPFFVGNLNAMGSAQNLIVFPGVPCPLNATVDAVALELDATTGAFIQASPPTTIGL